MTGSRIGASGFVESLVKRLYHNAHRGHVKVASRMQQAEWGLS